MDFIKLIFFFLVGSSKEIKKKKRYDIKCLFVMWFYDKIREILEWGLVNLEDYRVGEVFWKFIFFIFGFWIILYCEFFWFVIESR